MGRAKHCSEERRELIKKLIKEGKTYKCIQEMLGCSPTVISNAVKYKEKPETRGRKRKTSNPADRDIGICVKRNPFYTSTKIKQDLNLDIDTSTIRKRLLEANLKGLRARNVPSLNKRQLKARIAYARNHKNWPLEKWRNVLFTDEFKIVLIGGGGSHQYVRRPPKTEFRPQYTTKTIKHGGGNIMVWGCFSWVGVGPIYWIKQIMNADKYVEILETVMLPYAEYDMPLKWVMQQDNDPKHTSKKAKEWFLRNKIEVMEWPAQSPDLNPIENLWADIKKNISNSNPRNSKQLWEITKSAWVSIPVERFQNLINSMPRRMCAVLKAKGYTTKY